MRRGFGTCLRFSALIGAILLFLPWGVPGAEQPSGPKMVMKELEYDFKQVKEGAVIEHSFVVLNKGDQALEIKQVRPG
jgi:hypothetical protein